MTPCQELLEAARLIALTGKPEDKEADMLRLQNAIEYIDRFTPRFDDDDEEETDQEEEAQCGTNMEP
jgi:hypothetical protein